MRDAILQSVLPVTSTTHHIETTFTFLTQYQWLNSTTWRQCLLRFTITRPFFIFHYLVVFCEFRNMPPGSPLTTLPVFARHCSRKLTGTFKRSVSCRSWSSGLSLVSSVTHTIFVPSVVHTVIFVRNVTFIYRKTNVYLSPL